MENRKKSIDNLKNEFVKSENIKGGGMVIPELNDIASVQESIPFDSNAIANNLSFIPTMLDPLSHDIDMGFDIPQMYLGESKDT